MNNGELVQVLQSSIAPCMMISGVGLLLLSFSNRLARPVDRLRQMSHEFVNATPERKAVLKAQMRIFYKRSKILQAAVQALTISLFSAGHVILFLFISLTFQTVILEHLIRLSFLLSVAAMITGLAFFFRDIQITLKSVRLEIKDQLKD